MKRTASALTFTSLLLTLGDGCVTPQPTVSAEKASEPLPSTTTGAADGVKSPALARLLVEHWEETLRRNPLMASRLGDHRYDDQLPDRSAAARDEEKKLRR